MKQGQGMKLLIGAGGIYCSFLTYGKLHEQIFKYTADDGSRFTYAFFLQVMESLVTVVVAAVGLWRAGRQQGLPLHMFMRAGVSQVLAKACTSLALAHSLSFPVVTLAKSGKMVPVMAGSILLGGKSYSWKQYLSVAAIIAGTVIVTMDQKKGGGSGGGSDSWLGLAFILASLTFDGVVGGMQSDIQNEATAKLGARVAPWDMMFWMNLFMAGTAALFCALPLNSSLQVVLPEGVVALQYCERNPVVLQKILLFAACSATGQAFIFYTISNFDPLTTTTITTTRKVSSTVLSILTEGHSLSAVGWAGLTVASAGISMEIVEKTGAGGAHFNAKAPAKKVT